MTTITPRTRRFRLLNEHRRPTRLGWTLGAVVVALIIASLFLPRSSAGIEYEVTSDGNIATISYDSGGSTSQVKDASIQWNHTIDSGGAQSVVAQAGDGATFVTCTILVGGEVVADEKSTGEHSVVTCNH